MKPAAPVTRTFTRRVITAAVTGGKLQIQVPASRRISSRRQPLGSGGFQPPRSVGRGTALPVAGWQLLGSLAFGACALLPRQKKSKTVLDRRKPRPLPCAVSLHA